MAVTFVMAAIATCLVTVNVFGDLTHPTLVTAELALLVAVQVLRHQKLWPSRELLMYLAFIGYALLSLSWTDNVRAALVTVPAIVNFGIVLLLYSALSAFHNLRALLAGIVAGFAVAALLYTATQGFPFHVPDDFSYNTIAFMYLFGFLMTLISGAYAGRRMLPLVGAVVLLVLIAATTSIKTNLGVALGIFGATVLYFKPSAKGIVRGALVLAVLGAGLAYAINSNPDVAERVTHGFERVSLGFSVLVNRENDTGSTGLGTREGWKKEGLKGWAATPVFGHGVEAFRADFGITSHSTPIDLLYNSGIIGCGLFYGLLGSIAWRLFRARDKGVRNVRARIAVGLIAWSFISLSGIIYYDPFVAMFVGVVTGFLMRTERRNAQEAAALGAGPAPDGLAGA